jgi:hypothetical protein
MKRKRTIPCDFLSVQFNRPLHTTGIIDGLLDIPPPASDYDADEAAS